MPGELGGQLTANSQQGSNHQEDTAGVPERDLESTAFKHSTASNSAEPYALADITDSIDVRIVEMNEAGAESAGRIGVRLGDAMNGKGITDDTKKDGLTKYQQLASGSISEYHTEAVFFDAENKPILFSLDLHACSGPDPSRKYMEVTWREQALLVQPARITSSGVIELAHALTSGPLAEAAIAAALIDTVSARYVALNHAYAELTGFDRSELIGAPTKIAHREDFWTGDSSGRIGEIISGKIDSFTTTSYVAEDPLIQRTVTIGAAEKGRVARKYLVIYVSDSPIEANINLTDPGVSLQSIMRAGIPENIFSYALIDHDWRLQFIIPELESFGASPQQPIGFSVLPNIHPADLPAFLLVGENVRTGEFDKSMVQIRFRSFNDDVGYFYVEATLERPLGMPPGWLSVTSRIPDSISNGDSVEARLAAITQAAINEGPRERILGNPISSAGIQQLVAAHKLTERERQILTLLADGYRVRTMARTLHLTNGTVRNYLSAIFHKVGVRSQAELMDLILGHPIGEE